MTKISFTVFLCFLLSSCEHVNFLYKCSESSTDEIGDHKIKCKEGL